MSTIVTRAGKGSALTWTEGDANITNLNNDKIEDIVEDLTPQLGGDLDVNGKNITSASNGNINITPNGSGNISLAPATGKIILGSLDWPTTAGTNGQVLTTNGTGAASWTTISSGGIANVVEDLTPQLGGDLDVNGKNIVTVSNGNINLTPNGTGNIYLSPASGKVTISATNFPTGAGTNGQFLQTDGTGNASWATVSAGGISNLVEDLSPQLGGALDVNGQQIVSSSNGNISIVPNGSGNIQLTPATGKITLGSVDWPTTSGTNGQVLTTDGSGTASWTTVSGGASSLDGLSDVVLGTPATGEVLYYDGANWIDQPTSSLTVGTATSATNAANITIASVDGNSSDTTMSVVLVPLQTAVNQAPHIDTGLYFNASTNTLTASKFSGGLDGAIGSTLPSTGSFTRLTVTSATNVAKLTLDATALSSSAWTTNGIGLKVQSAIYTDTGSSGTIAASHVHVIGAPTMASTSATTVTDAATLYISNNPTAGTNTTITNSWALLTPGKIKAATVLAAEYRETVFAYGNSGVLTWTPAATNGTVQTITLTGNLTLSAFTSPISGQTITFIITQDATGSRTLTSTMKFAGASKTLSTAANSIDILTVSYIGTTYYASLSKGFA